MRLFFAASIPFLIAEGTSFALPTPNPTTPWPSPTTTSALKLRFLPPLTTFVTRLIETTVSLISSCEASSFSRVRFISATSELQAGFTRRVGHRLHAPVIQKSVAIEHHALHALSDETLGDHLADRLGSFDIAALRFLWKRGLHCRLDGRGRGDRLSAHVVHDLHVHVADAAEDSQPRPLESTRHAPADPVLDALATIVFGFDPHRTSLEGAALLFRSRLSDLLLQHFTGVAHALLLVRIGLPHPPDVGGDLADQLSVHAGDDDVRLLVDGDVDADRDVENHRVRVAEREMHLLALQLRTVADADDVELLLESLGDAGHGVGHETPREAVKLAQLLVVTRPLGDERAIVLREEDAGRNRLTQLALRPLHLDRVGRDLDGHAFRNRDRFLTYSRHC